MTWLSCNAINVNSMYISNCPIAILHGNVNVITYNGFTMMLRGNAKSQAGTLLWLTACYEARKLVIHWLIFGREY